MDTVSGDVRSKIMKSIRSRNTKPELIVRKSLFAMGYRYRVNDRRLPGSPDIVFPKYHAVINVHGCFWHGHGCYLFKQPETREEFWKNKIESNRRRDQAAVVSLLDDNWKVAIVWECAVRGKSHLEEIGNLASALSDWLQCGGSYIEFSGGYSSSDSLRYETDFYFRSVAEKPISEYRPEQKR